MSAAIPGQGLAIGLACQNLAAVVLLWQMWQGPQRASRWRLIMLLARRLIRSTLVSVAANVQSCSTPETTTGISLAQASVLRILVTLLLMVEEGKTGTDAEDRNDDEHLSSVTLGMSRMCVQVLVC
jgi:hypothetical protein